jgi:hypothetical protein
MNHHLIAARFNLNQAAEQLTAQAEQAKALATLMDPLIAGKDAQIPIEDLAKALQPLGLCIVHKSLVLNTLALLSTVEDADGLSGTEMRIMEERFSAALKGAAT